MYIQPLHYRFAPVSTMSSSPKATYRLTMRTRSRSAYPIAAAACCLLLSYTAAVAAQRLPPQPAAAPASPRVSVTCPPYIDTNKYRTTNYTDILNTTVSISPKRSSAGVPLGGWISGRATYYGTDERWENIHTACGDPPGQYGVIEQGSCGYTNSDGTLAFAPDVYVAPADTNEDYPGSCGRCYQVWNVCVFACHPIAYVLQQPTLQDYTFVKLARQL